MAGAILITKDRRTIDPIDPIDPPPLAARRFEVQSGAGFMTSGTQPLFTIAAGLPETIE